VASVYGRLCLSVFDDDKVLLALMIAFQLMRKEAGEEDPAAGDVDSELLRFFLRGPFLKNPAAAEKVLTQREKDELEYRLLATGGPRVNPKKERLLRACPWLTARQFDGLLLLERQEAFSQAGVGLVDHITDHPDVWKAFVDGAVVDLESAEIPAAFEAMPEAKDKKAMAQAASQAMSSASQEPGDSVFDVTHEEDDGMGGAAEAGSFEIGDEALEDDEQLSKHDGGGAGQASDGEDSEAEAIDYLHGYGDESDSEERRRRVQAYEQARDPGSLAEERQKNLARRVLMMKLCLLRVLSPDQVIHQIRRVICKFAGQDLLAGSLRDFNVHEIFKHTDHLTPNLLVIRENVDTMAEVMSLRKVLPKKDMHQLHYLPLGELNLEKLPALVAHAAHNGHWVLLDCLHFVHRHIPAIQKFLQ